MNKLVTLAIMLKKMFPKMQKKLKHKTKQTLKDKCMFLCSNVAFAPSLSEKVASGKQLF